VGNRSLATQLMPYTGVYVLLFVIWHILDFTFADLHGARAIVGGENLGLYGVVVNSFADPAHSLLYIAAVCFLSLHLSHGTESCIQTFGFNNRKYMPALVNGSRYFALAIAAAYSSIPIYVLFFLT
jgi:succinate dehydrogenase / fumarate reductase, cytochrome b subunit